MPDVIFNLQSWQVKRQQTFFAYCTLACCLGTEYSIIIPSLWFYLKNIIKTNHRNLYYGATLSSYYVSAIIGSFVITRFVDKYRNLRAVMLTLLLFEIFGNILYSIPVSPWFPLAGRFVQGLGDVNMSIMTAEIARSFPKTEITSKISILVACFSTTFVIAPALNIVFKYVDFEVYGFRVSYGNLPGLLMVFLFIIVTFIIFFKTSNISKEFDYKEEEQEEEEEEEEEKEEKNNETIPLLKKKQSFFKNLFIYVDVILLISLGFILSFSVVAFLDVAMPILASKYYNFTSQETGILFCVIAFVFMIVLAAVKKLSKRYTEYILIQCGLVIFIFSTSMLLAVTRIGNSNYYIGTSLLIGYVVLLGICWCIEQVLIRSLLCKIIPSSNQTLIEGIRRSASSLACILSGLLTALMLDYIGILCGAVIAITIFLSFCIMIRKTTLKAGRVIK